MASVTPSAQLLPPAPAPSIAQSLPNEIIEEIQKSFCAVDGHVRVKGFTRKAREFAGVCSAWRAVALGRGQYSVYSLKSLKKLAALFEQNGRWRDGAIGLRIIVEVASAAHSEMRAAVVQQILKILPNSSSIELKLGWTVKNNTRAADRVSLPRELCVELAKMVNLREFRLEEIWETISFEDLQL